MTTPPMMTPPGGAGRASLQSTTGRIAAVATALLLVLFLVLSVSRAAFTATTENDGNSAQAGGVTLTDNDTVGEALFSFATDGDLAPGDTLVQCIHVRYEGAFDSGNVKMYIPGTNVPATVGELAPYLNVKVETEELGDVAIIADDPARSCALFETVDLLTPLDDSPVVFDGTLAPSVSGPGFGTSYASGEEAPLAADQFQAVGNSTFAYKITVSVLADPAAAGKTATWDFKWETKSA